MPAYSLFLCLDPLLAVSPFRRLPWPSISHFPPARRPHLAAALACHAVARPVRHSPQGDGGRATAEGRRRARRSPFTPPRAFRRLPRRSPTGTKTGSIRNGVPRSPGAPRAGVRLPWPGCGSGRGPLPWPAGSGLAKPLAIARGSVAVHSALCTPHSALRTPHSALRTSSNPFPINHLRPSPPFWTPILEIPQHCWGISSFWGLSYFPFNFAESCATLLLEFRGRSPPAARRSELPLGVAAGPCCWGHFLGRIPARGRGRRTKGKEGAESSARFELTPRCPP